MEDVVLHHTYLIWLQGTLVTVMADRNFIVGELFIFCALFLRYLSSDNPGYLVFCLGIIGALISTSNLINFNRISYYLILLSVIVIQSIILINTYLFQMTYLQSNEQYIVLTFGVFAYLFMIILLFKPNIFQKKIL